jgi:CAAX protease family protein
MNSADTQTGSESDYRASATAGALDRSWRFRNAKHDLGKVTAEPKDPGVPPKLLASRRHTCRFILIVAGIALAGILQSRRITLSLNASHLPLYLSIAGLQLLFAWFINLGIRTHGNTLLDLLGHRWRSVFDAGKDLTLAVAFVVFLRGCTIILQTLIGPSFTKATFLLPIGPMESSLWIVVSIIAGLCEELVYRGYLQRQLWALIQSFPLALLLQACIFAAAHIYQGWKPALITGFYGIAFGLLAAWRRSIIPGAMAHSLIDIIGGFARH